MRREFGLLGELGSYVVGPYRISPLESARETLREIRQSDELIGDWIDPSPNSALRRGGREEAPNASLFYQLPWTHVIEGDGTWKGGGAQADREIEFLVTYLGFLEGVRLVPEGWSFFSRVPFNVGRLVDFRCAPSAAERLLNLGYNLWTKHEGSAVQTHLFAAVHLYLLAECFQHEYEAFAAQYTVLDICWRIHCALEGKDPLKLGHAKRALALVDALGLDSPSWLKGAEQSPLARVRNEFVHEGLYGGKPIGFGFPVGESNFDLAPFNSRLLLALLGVRDDYTCSPISAMRASFRT